MADEDLNPVPQPDPAPEPDPAPKPDPAPPLPTGSSARRCLVVDATPGLQAWVDQAYGLLPVVAGPDSDDPAELPEGTVVVTVAAVWRAVERAFSTADETWSIIDSGLPALDDIIDVNGPADTGNPIRRWFCAVFGC